MKGRTNNIAGRPTKGGEKRKSVSYRLQPSTIEKIKDAASDRKCSQSDVIEDMVAECYH